MFAGFSISVCAPRPISSLLSHCFPWNIFVSTGRQAVTISRQSFHIFTFAAWKYNEKTFWGADSVVKWHRRCTYFLDIFLSLFLHLHSLILLWCENRKELCLNSTTLVPCGSDPASAISQSLLWLTGQRKPASVCLESKGQLCIKKSLLFPSCDVVFPVGCSKPHAYWIDKS